jgi:hypothetical protein
MVGDGVLFYFVDGGINYTGQAGLSITAPNVANCLGTDGDPTASCTYKGIAIFSARNNTSVIEVRGNGGNAIYGMIYAVSGTVQASGGGVTSDETGVVGQVICSQLYGDGNGSFKVTYDPSQTYIVPPQISLQE